MVKGHQTGCSLWVQSISFPFNRPIQYIQQRCLFLNTTFLFLLQVVFASVSHSWDYWAYSNNVIAYTTCSCYCWLPYWTSIYGYLIWQVGEDDCIANFSTTETFPLRVHILSCQLAERPWRHHGCNSSSSGILWPLQLLLLVCASLFLLIFSWRTGVWSVVALWACLHAK